jgi:hypothetical protein
MTAADERTNGRRGNDGKGNGIGIRKNDNKADR